MELQFSECFLCVSRCISGLQLWCYTFSRTAGNHSRQCCLVSKWEKRMLKVEQNWVHTAPEGGGFIVDHIEFDYKLENL